MREGLTFSAILHFAVLVLAIFVLPRSDRTLDLPTMAIPIDIVELGKVSNAKIGDGAPAAPSPPPRPIAKPEPPTPAPPPPPAPQAEPQPAQKPPAPHTPDPPPVAAEPSLPRAPEPPPRRVAEPPKAAPPPPPADDDADAEPTEVAEAPRPSHKPKPPKPEQVAAAAPEPAKPAVSTPPAKPTAPTPPAKPTAPAQTAKPAKPAETPTHTDPLAAVLQNVAKLRQQPSAAQQQASAGDGSHSAPGAGSYKLSMTDEDAIRRAVGRCWNVDSGSRNAKDLVVEIKVEVGPDRVVRAARVVDLPRMGQDPLFRSAAERAVRAVLNPACNPLPLPPHDYEKWRDITFTFNPRDML
ncbi:MAG: hypothetical protein GC191_21270 [Azospirillum sp.]|nr:hypothetical protein [Azospirillum sp.]